MIRVFIVAASAVVRAGLEALVRSEARFEIAGTASDPAAATESMADVVVIDQEPGEPPPMNGVPTVILTGEHDPDWTREALRAGARAVLARDATREEIFAAIEAAAAGLVVVEPASMEALAGRMRGVPTEPMEPLTPREIEVLRMLAEGEGNKSIAWKLGISERTARFHVASIMAKLHAASRTEAVTIGVRRGLILL